MLSPLPSRTHRRWLVTALAGLVLPVACSQSPSPPETERIPVVETIHGVEIEDPYRWLEDQDAPKTRAWLREQAAYTERILEPAEPIRESFRARLAERMDVPDVGSPRKAGDRELFTLRRVGEPVAAIVARPAASRGRGHRAHRPRRPRVHPEDPV